MNSPAVSVILPVYNGERYLRPAIESVLAQTLRNLELIVIDDGSTDSSPDVARAYGDRIRYVRQNNAGVASAFNHGLRLVTGRYVSWLSHDDLFEPAKLEMQVQAVSGCAAPAVCYTDASFIDSDGVVIRELEVPDHAPGELLRNLFVCGPIVMSAYSLFFDRRCIDEVGMYDESQSDTQDADMVIRLARRFPFKHVPQKLIRIRQHAGRDSYDQRWVREALKFYVGWSGQLSIEELFPELGSESTGLERARERVWLGDKYVSNEIPPFRKLAMMQYAKALRESPAILPSVVAKIAGLLGEPARRYAKNHRYFYRLGLRTGIARRYAEAKRKQQ
jgi:glycosyltransferase involved in cell wall biosynthesis